MKKNLNRRDLGNEFVVDDIQSAATTLVSLCSEIVTKIGREETSAEQIQMKVLLVQGIIWEVYSTVTSLKKTTMISTSTLSQLSLDTTQTPPESVVATVLPPAEVASLREQVAQIHDASVAFSQRIGNDLVLFSCACLPLLCEDFVSAISGEPFYAAERALSDALTKLSGLVRGATATRTLRDAIADLRDVIVDIGEAKEVESIHSLGPLATAFIEQMDEVVQRAFGYDEEGFAAIAEALGSVGDQVTWGCHAVAELITEESGARGNYDRVSAAAVALITQLRDDIWVHIQRLGKDQTVAIKISCTAFQVCEAFYKLLRTSLSVQRFMKRKGTLFDEDEDTAFEDGGGSDFEDFGDFDEENDDNSGGCGGGKEKEKEKKSGNENENGEEEEEEEEDDNIVEDEDEDDCDVWKEPPDSSANIMLDKAGKVKAGNLNKLVERLTMEKGQDIVFQKTFVTTYRSFTTPEAFFRKLRQRFNMDIPHLPPSVSPSEYRKLFILPVQLRVINVLRQWIDTSIFDFDDALIARIRAFISGELDQDAFRGFARQLGEMLTRKLEERSKAAEDERSARAIVEVAAAKPSDDAAGEGGDAATPATPAAAAAAGDGNGDGNSAGESAGDGEEKVERPPMNERWMVTRERSRAFTGTTHAKVLSSFAFVTMGTEISMDKEMPIPMVHDEETISKDYLKIFQYTSEEIAEQLTFLDSHYYHMIRPVELLNKSWSKNKGARSPNVAVLIRRFNEVSHWVASLILAQKTAPARSVMWSRFVVIGDALLRLKNFNSLLAILSAFNVSAINRLRETRRLMPPPMLKWIEAQMKLMNSEGSYHTYRETLHTVEPPAIPYLGVYLTDLTFIEDGNQNFIDGLINFKKRQMIYNIIADVQLYQQDKYNIPPNPAILSFLSKLESKSEIELYKLSLVREPRTAAPTN